MLPEQKRQIQQQIDSFYSAAVARHPTYETVVHRDFCQQVLEAFPDPYSAEGSTAHDYACEEYDYLTPEQIAEDDAKNNDEGICSHGMDWLTCPRGCFG